MRNKNLPSQAGFTLIESLLYIALFSIIIGGALVAVYQMIESSDAVSAKNIVEMEGSFLLRKIDWALTGISDTCTPALGALCVNKTNFADNPIKIGYDAAAKSAWMIRGTEGVGSDDILTSGNIEITNLTFTEIPPSGDKPK